MPSKFLVPFELPDYQGIPTSSADPGFVLTYIKLGWWVKSDGVIETDLVLQRPLDGFTEVNRYANPVTASDTVLSAMEKIQRSLSTLKLVGDVTGTAQYVGGELVIQTTGSGGIDCTELLNCQVIIDIQGDITSLQGSVNALQTTVDLVLADVINIQGSITVLESAVAAAQLDIANLYGVTTGLDTRVFNLENAGFLTSYTETDPVYSASVAAGILSTDLTNWNTAYGWGDHSQVGYLTSFTEQDPIFSSSPAFSILQADIDKWFLAYGWGNHADAGYVPYNGATSDVDLGVYKIIAKQVFVNTSVDAGYALDVNGAGRVSTLYLGQTGSTGAVIKGMSNDGSIFIGGSSMSLSISATRNTIVSPVASYSTLSGINNSLFGRNAGGNLTTGASNVFIGSGAGVGISTGTRNVMVSSTDANNLPTSLSNSIHIVAGSGYRLNDASTIPSTVHAFIGGGYNTSSTIKDFYFGQMPFTADAGGRLVDIIMHAPSGFGTDIGGAHFTIAGGRGTGTGTPGDIILRTSNTGVTGSTVQTLVDRVRIAGGTGSVTVSSLAGSGSRMVVADAAGLLSTQTIPNTTIGTTIVAKSVSDYTSVGTGTQALASVLIPANTFAAGDTIQVRVRFRRNANGTSAQSHIHVNTANNLTGATVWKSSIIGTTTRWTQYYGHGVIKNTTTNTELFATNTNVASDDAGNTFDGRNVAIDWTVDQYFLFSLFGITTPDVFILTFFEVIKR